MAESSVRAKFVARFSYSPLDQFQLTPSNGSRRVLRPTPRGRSKTSPPASHRGAQRSCCASHRLEHRLRRCRQRRHLEDDQRDGPDPAWQRQTDSQLTLTMGAIEFDPTDSTNQTLLAGMGASSSFGDSGGLFGLLRTDERRRHVDTDQSRRLFQQCQHLWGGPSRQYNGDREHQSRRASHHEWGRQLGHHLRRNRLRPAPWRGIRSRARSDQSGASVHQRGRQWHLPQRRYRCHLDSRQQCSNEHHDGGADWATSTSQSDATTMCTLRSWWAEASVECFDPAMAVLPGLRWICRRFRKGASIRGQGTLTCPWPPIQPITILFTSAVIDRVDWGPTGPWNSVRWTGRASCFAAMRAVRRAPSCPPDALQRARTCRRRHRQRKRPSCRLA